MLQQVPSDLVLLPQATDLFASPFSPDTYLNYVISATTYCHPPGSLWQFLVRYNVIIQSSVSFMFPMWLSSRTRLAWWFYYISMVVWALCYPLQLLFRVPRPDNACSSDAYSRYAFPAPETAYMAYMLLGSAMMFVLFHKPMSYYVIGVVALALLCQPLFSLVNLYVLHINTLLPEAGTIIATGLVAYVVVRLIQVFRMGIPLKDAEFEAMRWWEMWRIMPLVFGMGDPVATRLAACEDGAFTAHDRAAPSHLDRDGGDANDRCPRDWRWQGQQPLRHDVSPCAAGDGDGGDRDRRDAIYAVLRCRNGVGDQFGSPCRPPFEDDPMGGAHGAADPHASFAAESKWRRPQRGGRRKSVSARRKFTSTAIQASDDGFV